MQTKAYKLSQRLTPIATALFFALTPYAASAEKDDHDHEMEQHGSHEHGVARLTVAAIDDGLEVSLESPAANVFGFEYKAKTEEEREVVHGALEKLRDGSALFAINTAASCALENVTIEAPSAEQHDDHGKEEKHDDHDHEKEKKHDDHDHEKKEKHDDHDHEKEKKHDDHDHEKKEKHDDHDHEKKDKHDDHDHEKKEKHDDHDHADEESTHSDVEAVWAFHCEKPAAIETVNVKLFSAFPGGFEEIAVEWITAANAGKVVLKEDSEVSLKP